MLKITKTEKSVAIQIFKKDIIFKGATKRSKQIFNRNIESQKTKVWHIANLEFYIKKNTQKQRQNKHILITNSKKFIASRPTKLKDFVNTRNHRIAEK